VIARGETGSRGNVGRLRGQAEAGHTVTNLLSRWRAGDPNALDQLMPRVYLELRRLARQYLRKERGSQTLETRDLIHEAFLRLQRQMRVDWQNRAHFLGIAATMMRRILVDRARRRNSAGRGSGRPPITLAPGLPAGDEGPREILALHHALLELEQVDHELGKIVELRFFGGMEHEEVAALLQVSEGTVRRRWRLARAWLYRTLRAPSDDASRNPRRSSDERDG
jgi:RNA polymerase sigma factor (TIGR02999 family)